VPFGQSGGRRHIRGDRIQVLFLFLARFPFIQVVRNLLVNIYLPGWFLYPSNKRNWSCSVDKCHFHNMSYAGNNFSCVLKKLVVTVALER